VFCDNFLDCFPTNRFFESWILREPSWKTTFQFVGLRRDVIRNLLWYWPYWILWWNWRVWIFCTNVHSIKDPLHNLVLLSIKSFFCCASEPNPLWWRFHCVWIVICWFQVWILDARAMCGKPNTLFVAAVAEVLVFQKVLNFWWLVKVLVCHQGHLEFLHWTLLMAPAQNWVWTMN